MTVSGGDDWAAAFTGPPDKDVATAVLVDEQGRYLLQLRDTLPGLPMSGHWGLFGGTIEPGETPEEGLRREILEELAWSAREVFPLVVTAHLVWPAPRPLRKHFFVVPYRSEEVAGMVLGEGEDMGVFTADEIRRLDRIIPWDLAAILAHAYHRRYWPDNVPPAWLG